MPKKKRVSVQYVDHPTSRYDHFMNAFVYLAFTENEEVRSKYRKIVVDRGIQEWKRQKDTFKKMSQEHFDQVLRNHERHNQLPISEVNNYASGSGNSSSSGGGSSSRSSHTSPSTSSSRNSGNSNHNGNMINTAGGNSALSHLSHLPPPLMLLQPTPTLSGLSGSTAFSMLLQPGSLPQSTTSTSVLFHHQQHQNSSSDDDSSQGTQRTVVDDEEELRQISPQLQDSAELTDNGHNSRKRSFDELTSDSPKFDSSSATPVSKRSRHSPGTRGMGSVSTPLLASGPQLQNLHHSSVAELEGWSLPTGTIPFLPSFAYFMTAPPGMSLLTQHQAQHPLATPSLRRSDSPNHHQSSGDTEQQDGNNNEQIDHVESELNEQDNIQEGTEDGQSS